MWIALVLTGCGWWERHQACSAAETAESSAWAALEAALDADAKLIDPGPTLTTAEALEKEAIAEAAKAEAPPVNTGEAAQDAFTRASRAYGTESGLTQAKWTDWSMRTQGHAAEADRQTARVARAIARVDAWADTLAESRLQLALLRARYDAEVRTGEARLGVALAFQSLGELAPVPEKSTPEVTRLHLDVATAHAQFDLRAVGLKGALADADRLAFHVERAGQAATTDASDYRFLEFPPEAQIAQAAALAAGAAGTRASEAAVKLRAASVAYNADAAADPVLPPASTSALEAAITAVKASVEACR